MDHGLITTTTHTPEPNIHGPYHLYDMDHILIVVNIKGLILIMATNQFVKDKFVCWDEKSLLFTLNTSIKCGPQSSVVLNQVWSLIKCGPQ